MNKITIPVKQTTTVVEIDVFSPYLVYIRQDSYFPYAVLVFRAGDSKNAIEVALHFDTKEVLQSTLEQLLKQIGEQTK